MLLGLGLAMDASCVSMANGLKEPSMKKNKSLLISSLFGIFQGLMPCIGYLLVFLLTKTGDKFIKVFNYLVPWIALGLLLYLGIKMIVESVRKNKDGEVNNSELTVKTIILQAVATSIDALSVGIIYGTKPIAQSMITFLIITIITFILSFISLFIGKKFGTKLSNVAGIIGGVILIIIGLEIYFTHFNDVIEGISALFSLL